MPSPRLNTRDGEMRFGRERREPILAHKNTNSNKSFKKNQLSLTLCIENTRIFGSLFSAGFAVTKQERQGFIIYRY